MKHGKRLQRSYTERGVGLVFLILVVAVVGVFVFGMSTLKANSSRLYRFTDKSGTVQFVDSLDKVPLDQRAAAASQPNVAPINKGDFRSFVDKIAPKAKQAVQEKSGR
jgi:hypothetical protein